MDGYYTSPGDHYEICKPEGKTDSAFQRLCELLRKVNCFSGHCSYLHAVSSVNICGIRIEKSVPETR